MAEKIEVGLLQPDDAFPLHLQTGYEGLSLDPEWVWVARREQKIIGVLVGCNNHGLLFLWRFVIEPTAPATTALRLLRKMFSDCRQRGIRGYMTFFDLTTDSQYQLARAAAKVGAKTFPAKGVWMAGTTEVYR